MEQKVEQSYMQQYYAKNRETMKAKLMAKVECPICKRTVSNGFLNKHKKMDICRRNQQPSTELTLEDKIKMLEDKISIIIKQI